FERLGTDQFSEWEEWFLRSERVRELEERLKEIREKVSRLRQLREAEEWDRRIEELRREQTELDEQLVREEWASEAVDEGEVRKQVMRAEAVLQRLDGQYQKQDEGVSRLSTQIPTGPARTTARAD